MVAIFYIMVVVFHVTVVFYRMAKVVSAFVVFDLFQGFRFQAMAIPMGDSGASLHMMGLSSLTKIKRTTPFDNHAKFWIFRLPRDLWPQAPKQNSTLRSLRSSWVHLVDDSPSVLSFGKRPSARR